MFTRYSHIFRETQPLNVFFYACTLMLRNFTFSPTGEIVGATASSTGFERDCSKKAELVARSFISSP